jgi:hypothetical protein
MAESEQGELSLLVQEPESSPVAADPAKATLECKGIRSTSEWCLAHKGPSTSPIGTSAWLCQRGGLSPAGDSVAPAYRSA